MYKTKAWVNMEDHQLKSKITSKTKGKINRVLTRVSHSNEQIIVVVFLLFYKFSLFFSFSNSFHFSMNQNTTKIFDKRMKMYLFKDKKKSRKSKQEV